MRTALELIGIAHFHEIAIEYQEEGGERSASLLDEVGVLFFVHKAREAFRL